MDEDSITWILPLIVSAVPNLTTFGNADVYDGLELLKNINITRSGQPGQDKRPETTTKFEEINICLEDLATSRVHEDMSLRLKTLTREYLHWNQFVRPLQEIYPIFDDSDGKKKKCSPFHLDTWINKTFGFRGGLLMADHELVKVLPLLIMLHIHSA